MTPEQERAALESAVAADPYDAVSHFALADWLEERGMDDEALRHRTWTRERQEAEDFMDRFAAECSREPSDYHPDAVVLDRGGIIAAAHRYLDTGEYFVCLGFDTPTIAWSEMDAFWRHFEALTGKSLSDKGEGHDDDGWNGGGGRFVSCSC